ncbi:MAG: hypothetical protein ACLU9N_10795 [Clostridia bacterium]
MLRYISQKKIENLNYFDEVSLQATQNGKEIQILFSKNVDGDRYYEADNNENYLKLEAEMITLFRFLIGNASVVSIFSYEDDTFWTLNDFLKDCYPMLYDKRCIGMGIETDQWDTIKELLKRALKYEAFPLFLIQQERYTLIPTDHLDFFICGNEPDIEKLVKKFSKDKHFKQVFKIRERIGKGN